MFLGDALFDNSNMGKVQLMYNGLKPKCGQKN